MKALPRIDARKRMLRRIAAGTGANAYAQATTIGIQLLSLPLFLAHWDLARYGQWLVLSALPACITMADVGLLAAAGNRMTMLTGEGRDAEANGVFQSALACVLALCAAVALAGGVALWLCPDALLPTADSRLALAALGAGVLVAVAGGLPEAVYRATQRYASGCAAANTVRLAEWLGALAGLWLDGSYAAVALGALAARVAGTGAMVCHAAWSTPQLRWGYAAASRAEVRRCIGPALSFTLFPAANAANYQGMTLITAAALGPAEAALFNAYRTLARVTVQATATFSHALWPEFSSLYGAHRHAALARLARRSGALALVLALAGSVAAYLAAPMLLQVWSHGRIGFVPGLMALAMLYAALAGAWHVPRVLLLATNQHAALAWPFLAASLAVLAPAYGLAQTWQLHGVLLAMCLLEAAMLALTLHLALRLLRQPAAPPTLGVAA